MTSLTGSCPRCQQAGTVVDPEFVAGILGEEVSAGFGSMCMSCGALLVLSGANIDGLPVFGLAAIDASNDWSDLRLVARARDAVGLTDRRSPALALRLMLVLTNAVRE